MSRNVRIDEDVIEFLSSLAAKGETPGQVVRRLLREQGAPAKVRRERLLDARREVYRPAILRLLAAGPTRVVDLKPRLLESVRTKIFVDDLTSTTSKRPTWWYYAELEASQMIKEGLLDGTAPRGVWRLKKPKKPRLSARAQEIVEEVLTRKLR